MQHLSFPTSLSISLYYSLSCWLLTCQLSHGTCITPIFLWQDPSGNYFIQWFQILMQMSLKKRKYSDDFTLTGIQHALFGEIKIYKKLRKWGGKTIFHGKNSNHFWSCDSNWNHQLPNFLGFYKYYKMPDDFIWCYSIIVWIFTGVQLFLILTWMIYRLLFTCLVMFLSFFFFFYFL